jgi:hypothetical protein
MKLLYLDIETAPNVSYTWGGKYDQNVIAFQREKYILCFSYQWEGEGETHVVAQPDFKKAFKADRHDDKMVLRALWDLLDTADVVCGHNIRGFDLKNINSGFVTQDMPPPSPYLTVDTLKIARANFKFNSNSLKDLCITLGLPHKEDAGGFSTWLGAMEGDADSWEKMVSYARQDTALLPLLLKRLRPFAKGLPSMNFGDVHACPVCCAEEKNLTRRGFRYTKTGKFQTWHCGQCLGWSSSRISSVNSDDRPRRVS